MTEVRATRAYVAGFGTAGSLVAGAAMLFVLASAIVSFRGWPQLSAHPAAPTIVLGRAAHEPADRGDPPRRARGRRGRCACWRTWHPGCRRRPAGPRRANRRPAAPVAAVPQTSSGSGASTPTRLDGIARAGHAVRPEWHRRPPGPTSAAAVSGATGSAGGAVSGTGQALGGR